MEKQSLRFILVLLFAFLALSLHAQKKGYTQGYIVTTEGDTVSGWVKDRSSGTFLELYSRIRFKHEDALFRKRYSPGEILAYACSHGVYEAVPLREESTFMKFRYYVDESNPRLFLRVISKSERLTYYHWEYIDGESNYLDYIPLFYRNGSAEMVRVTQGVLGLKRKRLVEYFGDCQVLVEAIQEKTLTDITEVYHFYLSQCQF